jgi:hypothetical protein
MFLIVAVTDKRKILIDIENQIKITRVVVGEGAVAGGSRKIEYSSLLDDGADEFIRGRDGLEVEEGEERVGSGFVVGCD